MYLEWDTSNFATQGRPAETCISFPLFPQKVECQTLKTDYQRTASAW